MAHNNGIAKFTVKTLLAALPVIALLAWYAIADPFHVLHRYPGHITTNGNIALTINYGYVSTESFDYYNPSMRYDSFIFGSSMSQYYHAACWKAHLPAGASVCHFDASMETLDGIINKIRYVNSRGVRVKRALIVIEESMLHRWPQDGNPLYAQHYATTPACDYLKFQSLYFGIFRNPEFIKYMLWPQRYAGEMVDKHFATSDIQNRIEDINESYYARFDSLIAHSPKQYFIPARMARRTFAPMPIPYAPAIGGEMAARVHTLAQLLRANGTDYIVIIPPRYHRRPIAESDLYALQCELGNSSVFDFSHDSRLSNDAEAYYDNEAHLTAAKCALLLDSCYKMREYALESPYCTQRK